MCDANIRASHENQIFYCLHYIFIFLTVNISSTSAVWSAGVRVSSCIVMLIVFWFFLSDHTSFHTHVMSTIKIFSSKTLNMHLLTLPPPQKNNNTVKHSLHVKSVKSSTRENPK